MSMTPTPVQLADSKSPWAFLPYLYLLRCPLITLGTLVGLPVLALKTNASALLANLFDITPGGMIIVSLTGFTTAWTILTTGWLILVYGERRFHIPKTGFSYPIKPIYFLVSGLAALPVLIGGIDYSQEQSRVSVWSSSVCAFVGFSSALMLLGLVMLGVRLSEKFLGPKDVKETPKLIQEAIRWWEAHPNASAGYLGFDKGRWGGYGILPGHLLAALSFLATFLIYVLIGTAKHAWLGYQASVPTLAYVLLLLMLLCWGLSGVAFFFDRFRVPLLVPLSIILIGTSQAPQSDHFYRVLTGGQGTDVPPATAISAGNRSAVIVVAADGGGIQSAAWTARVLTGLEIKCRQEFGAQYREFGRSIRLISSVSGGSVGAMYFVNAYDQSGLPEEPGLKDVVKLAKTSSLDDIAWGLLYPDLRRTIFPFLSDMYAGRGQALERALTRKPELSMALSHWHDGVRSGWRPATVFNATIADTGQPLLIATSELRPGDHVRINFSELYPNRDIAIVTAVRLSATFPYVTPAARADVGGPSIAQFHVVDGGYYDNYALSTLVEWLDEALGGSDKIQRVLILQIRGATPGEGMKLKNKRGWFYQAFAPIATMLHVRTAGQIAHGEQEVKLLERAARPRTVSIESALFQFCGPDPPLTWHLTQIQKDAIEAEWENELLSGKGWKKVKEFLSRDRLP
jgi:predicted acylesterase/phospholipase RssA